MSSEPKAEDNSAANSGGERISPANLLAYESPRDHVERNPPVNVLKIALVFVIGFGAGAVASVFSIILLLFDGIDHGSPHPVAGIVVLFIQFVVIVAIMLRIVLWFDVPPARSLSKWFRLGTLFGLALALAVEGVFYGIAILC
jgi:hypothetical protein